MAKIYYPYSRISIQSSEAYRSGRTAHRPMVSATITASNGNWLRTQVLLDTGADSCVFPLTMAVLLKLDVFGLPKGVTGGVGTASNLTYYDDLRIELDGGLDFTVHAGFTAGLDPFGFGLLGQDGFFSCHHVEFRGSEGFFLVEPV